MPSEPIAAASPVALVINPGFPDEGLLYYKTDNDQLAIEHRPLYKDTFDIFKDHNPVRGAIVNPGCFAAVTRRGLVDVYGFTKYPTKDPTKPDPGNPSDGGAAAYVISRLSPVYNPISTLPESQSGWPGLAAVNDNQVVNWIFYIRFAVNPKNAEDIQPKVHEFSDTYLGDKKPSVLRKTKPNKNTMLAAVYHPDTAGRSVFYQACPDDNDHTLITMYSPEIRQDAIPIYNTGTAFLGTPLSVTSRGVGADLIMWLYYMTSDCELWRVVYRKKEWGKPQAVKGVGSANMKIGTALTVALHNEHNHIWFIKSDSTDNAYTGFRDSLDSDLN